VNAPKNCKPFTHAIKGTSAVRDLNFFVAVDTDAGHLENDAVD